MPELDSPELRTLISNRGSMYRMLARLYRTEVDANLLTQMTKMELPVESGVPELDAGHRELQIFLEHQTEHALIDLAVDYARIFLGIRRGHSAFPYESVYTSPTKLMMQEARDEVVRIYREEEIDRADGVTEPEDHIAFELEYMALLCQKAIDALDRNDWCLVQDYLKKQGEFLEWHLANWVPDFCIDLLAAAELDFYKSAAHLTRGFLELEQETIPALMGEVYEYTQEQR
ncbi:MAG TPA: molecular chaperone TorD family protein [Syntrophales bacterium]|nr:molecular chaperone TorD family protein [Syntrophales bacterium]